MTHSHPATAIALVALVVAACGGAAPARPTTAPAATSVAVSTTSPTRAPIVTPAPTRAPWEMDHGRSFHTATALADGRVLLAGGYFKFYPIKLVDLFEPTAGMFTATGSMAEARGFGSATLLADGRVLFTGGDPSTWDSDLAYFSSAEVYDPSTGTFAPTGSMATARDFQTATLLLDGRVLIVGGKDSGNHSLDTAELYDPTTGAFRATGSLAGPRAFHTATLLRDGRVLIVGGTADGWVGAKVLTTAEIYDPKTSKFTATGSLADGRASHTATLLADGRVLITGGTPSGGIASLASTELYDPGTGKFTATGSMADERTFQEATRLTDGRVLVTGGDPAGWLYDGPFLASAEIYDPKRGSFVATGTLLDKLTNHTATPLPDGRVLIAGGYNGSADVADAELFDVTAGTFSMVK